jgi:hypothetical protein
LAGAAATLGRRRMTGQDLCEACVQIA